MYEFHGWTVGETLANMLHIILRPGWRTLEYGSGLSTRIFEACGCRHTALEHNMQFAPQCGSVVHAPIVNGWYSWTPRGPHDCILIDGPPSPPGRFGCLKELDVVANHNTIILLDDMQREAEQRLAAEIAKKMGFYCIVVGPHSEKDFKKSFAILARPTWQKTS